MFRRPRRKSPRVSIFSCIHPLISHYRANSLGKMESALALTDGHAELLAEDVDVTIVGHLEVVDACHDGRKVVIGCKRWFTGLANDREHWCKSFEA
jgi:hypothetical protein